MTLQASGQISLSNINSELGLAADTTVSMSNTVVRTLLAKASGALSLADAYGKAKALNTNASMIAYPTPFGKGSWWGFCGLPISHFASNTVGLLVPSADGFADSTDSSGIIRVVGWYLIGGISVGIESPNQAPSKILKVDGVDHVLTYAYTGTEDGLFYYTKASSTNIFGTSYATHSVSVR